MLDSQNILITGGAGSFGRAFTEYALTELNPKRFVIYSRGEEKHHDMRQRWPDDGDSPMRYFIGNVRDEPRLRRAFHNVDIVIHAAALKQVPAGEYNPAEFIKTNVIGTLNVVEAAIDAGVGKVMLLSSDKAVSPTNLYGMTKGCAERLIVAANSYSGAGGTKFSAVRYGNVVGSRGSVIPLIKAQRENGTVTLTHEDMTRFWLTLDEGVRFVWKCITEMQGGEVFIPKLPSMRMTDLIAALAPDCAVKMIGIRPGEKLHECLLSEDEARHSVELESMYRIDPQHPWWTTVDGKGRTLPEGFSYRSDTNGRWLTQDELREMAG